VLLVAGIAFYMDFRQEMKFIILAVGLAKSIESIGDII
jgi:hypothetical protein